MLKKYVLAVFLALFAGAASATPAGIDVSAALTELTNAETAIASVGGAILVLAAIALAWRWVKASFF